MKFDQKQFHKANNTVQILIILGILIALDLISLISSWITKAFPGLYEIENLIKIK